MAEKDDQANQNTDNEETDVESHDATLGVPGEEKREEKQEEKQQEESEVVAESAVEAEMSTETEGEASTDPIEEIAQLKDQILRSLAEVENIKRRTSRDIENAHKFAVEKLLADLFPVIDSLEKAVETASATTGAQAIAEGVALSLKLFVDTLAKSGVEQLDPLGIPFDPQEHEALTMVPNPDAEPNSVMDVMAKGYKLNGRLVRAAKVIVVKGD